MIRALRRKVGEWRRAWRFRLARRVVLGGTDREPRGWLSTNRDTLDVLDPSDFRRYWRANTIRAFLAEHVWEHLSPEEVDRANANCYRFLQPGGRLRLAVPDGLHPDPGYIDMVRPGGVGSGADDHRQLFDYRSLTASLEKAGFVVKLLEFWDEDGVFHRAPWSSADGQLVRTSGRDPRNRNGVLAYTSLVVDAFKPDGP